MAKKTATVQEEQQLTDNSLAVVDELTETAIVEAEALPGLVGDDVDFSYGAEHAGSEHKIKGDELIIPMLKIVQQLSKVWKDRPSDSTIKLGDIYNTVTGEVYDGAKGVLLVPINSTVCVIERKPATAGGEFIAKLAVDDPRVVEAFKANGPDGWKDLTSKEKTKFNYTVEVHVALISPTDGVTALGVAMVPFGGTNVFPRKVWWSGMAEAPKDKNGKGSPRYAFRTVLATKFRQGKNGGADSYMYEPKPYGGKWARCRFAEQVPAHKETLDRCKQFAELLDSGALGRVDYSDADDSEAAQEAAALADQPAF